MALPLMSFASALSREVHPASSVSRGSSLCPDSAIACLGVRPLLRSRLHIPGLGVELKRGETSKAGESGMRAQAAAAGWRVDADVDAKTERDQGGRAGDGEQADRHSTGKAGRGLDRRIAFATLCSASHRVSSFPTASYDDYHCYQETRLPIRHDTARFGSRIYSLLFRSSSTTLAAKQPLASSSSPSTSVWPRSAL